MSKFSISHLTFGYDAEILFDDVSLNIDDSWHLGLVGRNGRGKTTLLKILSGELLETIGSDKSFHYFPQKLTDEEQLTFICCQSWKTLNSGNLSVS